MLSKAFNRESAIDILKSISTGRNPIPELNYLKINSLTEQQVNERLSEIESSKGFEMMMKEAELIVSQKGVECLEPIPTSGFNPNSIRLMNEEMISLMIYKYYKQNGY